MIGTLREAGFSVAMTAHIDAVLDGYVYGFALSEASLPINGPETVAEIAEPMMRLFSIGAYPYLVEFSVEHVMKPDYSFAEEFEFGLNLILDVERVNATHDWVTAPARVWLTHEEAGAAQLSPPSSPIAADAAQVDSG